MSFLNASINFKKKIIAIIRAQGLGFLVYFPLYVREEKRRQERAYAYAREEGRSQKRKRQSVEERMDRHTHRGIHVPRHEILQRLQRRKED
jgi:hypothetical protein